MHIYYIIIYEKLDSFQAFFNGTQDILIPYNDGQSVCEQYNGHLASIHSGDENSFIHSNIYCNKLKIF